MNNMNSIGIRVPVRKLVQQYPEKAVEILVRCCQDSDIQNEIVMYLLDPDLPPNNIAVDVPGTFNNPSARGPLHQISSNDRFGSPPTQRKPSDRSSGASISSHSRSLSSKDGRETIMILADGEQGSDEHPAQMRTAQVAFSVIGEHMFSEGRIGDFNTRTIPEQSIHLPRRGFPGAFVNVTVTACVRLTWQRPRSRTHSTWFYLVPEEMLDIDVLLGYDDSGEEPPGGMHSPPQKERGRSFGESGVNPPAQANRGAHINHVPSYHRSSHVDERSGDTITGLPDEILRRFLRQEQAQAEAGGYSNTPLPSHAPQNRQSQSEQPASRAPPLVPTPATHTSNQSLHTDKIRLSCTLATSIFNVWLHPDAGVEAFLANVQREFETRNKPFDRAVTTILLKPDRGTPDSEAKYLSLGENDMMADWEETMEWLRANKRKTSPHIYGVIRVDAG